MPTPLTRTLALILSLAAATWALQRPATHSLARRRGTTLSPYCDVNGCVVPESADESSGFGGIISPPWWDDFQEP